MFVGRTGKRVLYERWPIDLNGNHLPLPGSHIRPDSMPISSRAFCRGGRLHMSRIILGHVLAYYIGTISGSGKWLRLESCALKQ